MICNEIDDMSIITYFKNAIEIATKLNHNNYR